MVNQQYKLWLDAKNYMESDKSTKGQDCLLNGFNEGIEKYIHSYEALKMMQSNKKM